MESGLKFGAELPILARFDGVDWNLGQGTA